MFVECSFSCSFLSLSYRLIQFLDNSIKNVTWGCTLGNDGVSEQTANIFKYTIIFHFQNVGGTQVTSPVSSSTHRIAKVKTCPFSCKEHIEKFFSCKEQVEEVAFSCPVYQLLNCRSDFFFVGLRQMLPQLCGLLNICETLVSSVRWQRFQLSALKRERECQYIQTRGAVNRETFSISSRKI